MNNFPRVILTENKPIKAWCDLDEDTMQQAKNLANHPAVVGHAAIMADAHFGYGTPIGSVFTAEGTILPSAIGTGIGCGILAVKTNLKAIYFSEQLAQECLEVFQTLLSGRIKMKKDVKLPVLLKNDVIDQELAAEQLGTLGGGNHFVEIAKEEYSGIVWILVHSGSRRIGYIVANHYNEIAKELNRLWKSEIPESWNLAMLPIFAKEGRDYIQDMQYCMSYAVANRQNILNKMTLAIARVLASPRATAGKQAIDVMHNYASFYMQAGKQMVLHRKGAINADKGNLGIIPGSQGSPTYIVKGKGNRNSHYSCSHGAGRMHSRSDARKKLDLVEEQQKLKAAGVLAARIFTNADLDEAPGAYKDIHQVLENQESLVEIVSILHPLATYKQ